MKEKLLPCPFCGSEKLRFTNGTQKAAHAISIRCFECGAKNGFYLKRENCIETWNKRVHIKKASKNPLETYEMEHRRAEQLANNCRWLIGITDAINEELCPGKIGTWQQRAEFALEATKEIGEIRREKIMKRAQKHIDVLEKVSTNNNLQFD